MEIYGFNLTWLNDAVKQDFFFSYSLNKEKNLLLLENSVAVFRLANIA